MATNRFYSKTISAAAQHVLKCLRHCYITHNFFPCTNFTYPPKGILKTVNKFIVIKLNTKKFGQKSTKNNKNQSKKTLTAYKAM